MNGNISEQQPTFPTRGLQRGLRSHWSPFWRSEFRLADEQLSQPLRFRLGELFAAVTIAAVLLSVFRELGILGAALAFIAAVAFTNSIYPWLNREALARQETMFDFVWGVVMPVICLVFDPFVFKYCDEINQSVPDVFDIVGLNSKQLWSEAHLQAWAVPAYALIGWQLLILCIWLIAGRMPPDISAVWTGMLWTGFALACIVGGILFVPALVGTLFAGIGLLGLTPLFTARAYYRRALLAAAIATRELPSCRADRLALLGYWLAMPVPAAGLIVAWRILAA